MTDLTDLTDLTERLQRKEAFLNEDCDCGECVQCHGRSLMSEAATTLETLTQENARLREVARMVIDASDLAGLSGPISDAARKALGGGDEKQ